MALAPDAEQHARQLLEQAGRYTRAALQVPDDVDTLRAILSNLLLEVAMLRAQVDQLQAQMRTRR